MAEPLGVEFVKIVGDLAGLRSSFGEAQRIAGDGVAGISARIKAINPFTMLIAGATATAAALAAATVASAKTADEMGKMAQAAGLGVEEFSRLSYAAELSDVGASAFSGSLRILSRQMVSAADGGKEASEAFAKVGVNVRNADGSMKSSSQVLGEIAEKFAKTGDGAEKTALAMQLFGRAGAQMIPMLNGGADAIKAAGDEAEAFGLVIGEEFAKQADQFNDNFERMGKIAQGLAITVGKELVPIVVQVTDGIVRWYKENRVLIEQNLVETVDALARAFSTFGVVLGGAGGVGDQITFVARAAQFAAGAFEAWVSGIRLVINSGLTVFLSTVGLVATAALDILAKLGTAVQIAARSFGADAIADAAAGAVEKITAVNEGIRDFAWGVRQNVADANEGIVSGFQTMVGAFDDQSAQVTAYAKGVLEPAAGAMGEFGDSARKAAEELAANNAAFERATANAGTFAQAVNNATFSMQNITQAIGDAAAIPGGGFLGDPAALQAAMDQIATDRQAWADGMAVTIQHESLRALTEEANKHQKMLALAKQGYGSIEEETKRHEAAVTAITKDGVSERGMIAANYLGMLGSFLGQAASMQDASSKKGFEKQKKLRVAETIINTASGIVRAYADNNWIVATILAVALTAIGAMQLKQIRGQKFEGGAEAGLDTVPNTGTFLVHKGEAIVPSAPAEQVRRFPEVASRVLNRLEGEEGGGGGTRKLEVVVRWDTRSVSDRSIARALLPALNVEVRDFDGNLIASDIKGSARAA